MRHTAVLLISCPDQKGLVAAIADFLLLHNANILHADQHQDAELKLFLMRVEWELAGFNLDLPDPLSRYQSGELHCELPIVLSNHEDTRWLADAYRVPYQHLAIQKDAKHEAELTQLAIPRARTIDFSVLPRYMP